MIILNYHVLKLDSSSDIQAKTWYMAACITMKVHDLINTHFCFFGNCNHNNNSACLEVPSKNVQQSTGCPCYIIPIPECTRAALCKRLFCSILSSRSLRSNSTGCQRVQSNRDLMRRESWLRWDPTQWAMPPLDSFTGTWAGRHVHVWCFEEVEIYRCEGKGDLCI